MNIIERIKNFLNGTNISAGKISGSSIDGITVSGDILSVNTKYGHYEIGGKVGKTITIELDKYILTFIGGILIEVKEK